MTVDKLLNGVQNCSCGKNHICPIDKVIISDDAFSILPSATKNYNNILLVADNNTFAIAGERVKNTLRDKVKNVIVFDRQGILVPDEVAISELEFALKQTADCDLILGVGSGVINDLCKIVSFNNKLPYYIFATAPSMDGYASKGSALILNGMKVTLTADVPKAIIADVNVLKDAPFEMIQAGYGDIIGKFSCLNDWLLAKVVLGEYFCQFIYNETLNIAKETILLADGLKNREKTAVGKLMTALVAVGVFMAYVGNSRPASGSEHHLSHFFEIVGVLKGEEYLSHGIDVLYSAIETAKVRESLLKLDNINNYVWAHDSQKYQRDIQGIYGSLSNEIFALQEKQNSYKVDRVSIYKQKWQEICEVLRQAPSTNKMIELTNNVGLSYEDFIKFYGEEKISKAVDYAKDLKDRYTVLWLNADLKGL